TSKLGSKPKSKVTGKSKGTGKTKNHKSTAPVMAKSSTVVNSAAKLNPKSELKMSTNAGSEAVPPPQPGTQNGQQPSQQAAAGTSHLKGSYRKMLGKFGYCL